LLLAVYASTREPELAAVEWDAAQKAAFVEMQFDAQHAYYQEHYAGAAFDVILVDGQPAGRLFVSREENEIRIVDIALLPEYCNRGIGTTLLRELQSEAAAAGKPRLRSSRYGGQAAAHPRRTLQSRAEALRAPWVSADRGQRASYASREIPRVLLTAFLAMSSMCPT
jgi:GNAT superfamily N-acetyltransferase